MSADDTKQPSPRDSDDAGAWEAARRAAEADGLPFSAWLRQAIREASAEAAERAALDAAKAAGMPLRDWLNRTIKEVGAEETCLREAEAASLRRRQVGTDGDEQGL